MKRIKPSFLHHKNWQLLQCQKECVDFLSSAMAGETQINKVYCRHPFCACPHHTSDFILLYDAFFLGDIFIHYESYTFNGHYWSKAFT